MEELFRLYEGLDRLGPGSESSTRRALAMLPERTGKPRILDAGCGAGAASLVLAREIGGHVTAVDVHQPFLDRLASRAAEAGLSDRIVTRCQSMDALADPAGSYDLVWSEGAIYLIGFERGLELWRPLLRPGGHVCVTEASWLTDNPPAEAKRFWDKAYPEVTTVEGNIAKARSVGFETLGSFVLPRSNWEVEFYAPLKKRMLELRGDPNFAPVIEETEEEIRLYETFGDSYGYVFYVLAPIPQQPAPQQPA